MTGQRGQAALVPWLGMRLLLAPKLLLLPPGLTSQMATLGLTQRMTTLGLTQQGQTSLTSQSIFCRLRNPNQFGGFLVSSFPDIASSTKVIYP